MMCSLGTRPKWSFHWKAQNYVPVYCDSKLRVSAKHQGRWLGKSFALEGGWAWNRTPRTPICQDLCNASLLSKESIAPPNSVPPATLLWAVHPSGWWIYWREAALKLSPAESHQWPATRLVLPHSHCPYEADLSSLLLAHPSHYGCV